MSITGPDALRSIEEALRDIRREEGETIKRLAHAVEITTKLRMQRAYPACDFLRSSGFSSSHAR